MFQILGILTSVAAAVAAYYAATIKADTGPLHAPHDALYITIVTTFAVKTAMDKVGPLNALTAWLVLLSVGFQTLGLFFG